MKTKLDQTNADLQSQHSAYDQRQAELSRVEADLSGAQRQAQTGDAAAMLRAQSLIDRRDMLRSQLRDQVLGSGYADRLRQYNSDRQAYETQCRTRPMLKIHVEAAQKDPKCP